MTLRTQCSRAHLHYGSDVTDAEGQLIAPHLQASSGSGGKRRWPLREIIKAIFYVLRAGCPWRMLPDSLSPRWAVYRKRLEIE